MVDLLKGRWPSSQDLPPEITEFFIAQEFGWTYDYIRYRMSPKDMHVTVQLMNLVQKFKAGDLTNPSKRKKI